MRRNLKKDDTISNEGHIFLKKKFNVKKLLNNAGNGTRPNSDKTDFWIKSKVTYLMITYLFEQRGIDLYRIRVSWQTTYNVRWWGCDSWQKVTKCYPLPNISLAINQTWGEIEICRPLRRGYNELDCPTKGHKFWLEGCLSKVNSQISTYFEIFIKCNHFRKLFVGSFTPYLVLPLYLFRIPLARMSNNIAVRVIAAPLSCTLSIVIHKFVSWIWAFSASPQRRLYSREEMTFKKWKSW